jgi:hypothetical protein
MFPSFEIFNEVLNQCTENYECLVINKSSRSNNLSEQVYWYKAESHENFRIGYDVFWQHNHRNYDPTMDTRESGSGSQAQRKLGKYNVHLKKGM